MRLYRLGEVAEQGLVANLVVKDHSRLGRNRLVVGQLLEEDFVRLNVRYIAIMDNIDIARGVSDIVPMQDLFNEWHAKNTSDKVRRVMQSRGNAGIPLTTNPPFGYRKDPEDRNRWLVDEPAAEVVRSIFRMSVSGLGPTQIAKKLRSEGVMTPSEYQHSIGVKCPVKPPAFPHNWCSATVTDILDRQEYTGDTVNFRSFSRSFKQKKRLNRPPGGVEGVPGHPLCHHRLGDLRLGPGPSPAPPQAHKKPALSVCFPGCSIVPTAAVSWGIAPLITTSMNRQFFFCSAYRGNSDLCSAHFIREKVVEELVLEGLQQLLWYVQVYEKQFAQEQMEQFGLQERRELDARQRELEKAKQPVIEIDGLIQKSYKDMSKGLLSEERFSTLTVSLESEQKRLKEAIPEMEASVETATDKANDLQHFIERARQVTRLTELTPEIVHEFIEKIMVSQADKVDGKRHLQVDIYYKTIGLWCAPSPEEMEELFQKYLAAQKKKTA